MVLLREIVALLESFHPAGGIHYSLLTGEERMALAAELHEQLFFRGTGGEGLPAGTDHPGIGEILGVDFVFHLSIIGLRQAGLRPFFFLWLLARI